VQQTVRAVRQLGGTSAYSCMATAASRCLHVFLPRVCERSSRSLSVSCISYVPVVWESSLAALLPFFFSFGSLATWLGGGSLAAPCDFSHLCCAMRLGGSLGACPLSHQRGRAAWRRRVLFSSLRHSGSSPLFGSSSNRLLGNK
jgi:hypothetical protein